jgi:gamma-glutamylaminecyclotransferase
MPHVFVYGTLKRGGKNHQVIAGQRFVGAARTEPAFRLHQLDGYPGMVRGSPGLSIEGELWEVDPTCLARLDDLEGTGEGLYAREPVRLLPPHDAVAAETYLYRRGTEGRADLGHRFG